MNCMSSTAAVSPEPIAAVPADVPQPVPAAIETSLPSTPGAISMAANFPGAR
jgi:hypothetical protein